MNDDQLLDFDRGRHAIWGEQQEERVRQLLVEQPELFRNHLAIAKWIDQWAERVQGRALASRWEEGYVQGIREVAAHLRQGDLVPGSDLLRGDDQPST